METVYIIAPLLLLVVVLAAVWLDRFSVPVILVALGLGVLAGSDVLGLWHFDDVELANQVANAGLVFILFHGGLVTKRSVLKTVALPAGGMATWGVVLTAIVTFGVLRLGLGWPLERSLLLAAVISSTDAAATFSILRRQSLRPRVASTLEIESAANDPMAVLLTVVAVEALTAGTGLGWTILPMFAWKFVAGPVMGWGLARGAIAIFNRLNPQDRGYYYVVLLAGVLLTYGLAEAVKASGMLAAFTAGLVMGNQKFIYQQGIRNFSGALSTIANIGVFVMMGLLVFPSQWSDLWLDGIVLFLVLTFVARPVAVWLGTLGMAFEAKERHFMCWAGLRGAVPIVLATYPMAAGISAGQDVFNLVFFAVFLSVGLQGSTLSTLAGLFGLATPSRPQPRYGLDLVTMAHSDLDLIVVDLPDPKGRPGPRIRDLTLPPGAILTLIARGDEVVAPTGNTRLLGWDQVTVLAHAKDEAEVQSALLEPFERTVALDEPVARARETKPPESAEAGDDGTFRNHVVLVGHGDIGRVLARFLRLRRIPFVVIEPDYTTVATLSAQGVRVLHGHGEDPELLSQAGVENARMLLITATQPVATRRAIERAHRMNPELEVIARVHHGSLVSALSGFPRTRVVQGDVELAYAMARFMLLASGVSAIETEALIADARRGEPGATPTRFLETRIPPTSPVVGQRLAELALPPGSLVVRILRDGDVIVPGGQTEIRAGDVLSILTDTDQALTLERVVNPSSAEPDDSNDNTPSPILEATS